MSEEFVQSGCGVELVSRLVPNGLHNQKDSIGYVDAVRELNSNRLLADTANSFLVVARKSPVVSRFLGRAATLYSYDRRKAFRINTEVEGSQGSYRVRKRKLELGNEYDLNGLKVTESTSPWNSGLSLELRLLDVLRKEGIKSSNARRLVQMWLEYLNRNSYNWKGQKVLPPSFVDLTMSNCFMENEIVQVIDMEYENSSPLRFEAVVLRGLYQLWTSMQMSKVRVDNKELSLCQVLLRFSHMVRFKIFLRNIVDFIRLECKTQESVYGVQQKRTAVALILMMANTRLYITCKQTAALYLRSVNVVCSPQRWSRCLRK